MARQPEKEDLGDDSADAFMAKYGATIPNLPYQFAPETDTSTRAAVYGLLGGSFNYTVLPALLRLPRDGVNDEVSALLGVAAGAFIGSMHGLRALCAVDQVANNKRGNLAKGTGGGAVGGASLAALLPLVVASPPAWLVGALVVAGAALGLGGTAIIDKRPKVKHCPHCGEKGDCRQKVCRVCKRLYYPKDASLDCSIVQFVDWFTLSSYLHRTTSGALSYLDSELVVRDYFRAQRVEDAGSDLESLQSLAKAGLVKCDEFKHWFERQDITKFINRGTTGVSPEQLDDRLTQAGL
jgi:hypothetical protein